VSLSNGLMACDDSESDIRGQMVHLPCSSLFNRLIVLTERLMSCFTSNSSVNTSYMNLHQLSLFKDHMMRKPVKSALGQLSTKVKIVDNQFDGDEWVA